MTDDDFLQPGRTFDSFQLVEKLGEGAMGAVWKAMHLKLRRPVAIKFMKREAAKTENARNRFIREGEAAARVDHENVVKVHDVGVANGAMPYIVMELLEGEELRERFRAARQMPLAELVDLMLPVCAAVAAAHDEGIVHRDLKPENIFLARTRDRTVVPKVVDFGISRVSDDASGRVNTHTAALMGTPRYMSPEQVQGAKHVDARSDQYALGVILYEGLTGEPPFNDPVLYNLMGQIVAGQYRLPRSLRPDLPEALEAVVRKAMSVYAEHRFPNVRALAQALLPFASERSRHLYADRFHEGTGTLPEATLPVAWVPPSVPPASLPPVSAPPSLPATASGTTLGEAARELPTDPIVRPARRPGVVVVAGAVSLSLVVLATAVALRPSSGPAPTGASAAPLVQATATPSAPRAVQPTPMQIAPRPAAPTPVVLHAQPRAPAPVPPIAAPPPAPAAVASPVVDAPAPRLVGRPGTSSRRAPHGQGTARQPRGWAPAPGPLTPLPAAGTTAGGAPID